MPLGYKNRYFMAYNDELYFNARHPDYGAELWKSDGTNEGTVLVKDIDPTPIEEETQIYFGGNPIDFTVYGDYLYFIAYDPAYNGSRLFRTDGTENGTVVVLPNFNEPSDLTVYNGKIYFHTYNDELEVYTLYKTDGTPAGTSMVKSPAQGGPIDIENMVVFDNKLYFYARPNSNDGQSTVWVTDGTAAGTKKINDPAGSYRIVPAIATTNYLYLTGLNGTGGNLNTAIYRLGKNSTTIEQISSNDFELYSSYSDELYMTTNGCLVFTGNYTNSNDVGVEVYSICEQDTAPLTVKEVESKVAKIYPNPTNSKVIIADVNTDKIHEIQLYSISGEKLHIDFEKLNKSNVEINGLEKYTSGIYFLNILFKDGGRTASKLIIE